MIVIGADTHKGSHALAAVDDGTGKVRGQPRDHRLTVPGTWPRCRWAREPGRGACVGDRGLPVVFSAGSSRRCWRRASGSCGCRRNRMGASRKGEREPGKSDEIDALAVSTTP